MADSRLLLDGLRAYHAGLTSQLGILREEMQLLEASRVALDSVFHGDAAEQFRQNWSRTAQRLRTYLDEGTLLARGLEERITSLEGANADFGDL